MSKAPRAAHHTPQLSIKKIRKLIDKGAAAHRQGDKRRATSLYQKVLTLNPDNSDALQLLGLVEFEKGRNAAALELIGEAISANPNIPVYHYNFAVVCRSSADNVRAIEHLRTALALEPDYHDALDHAVLTCFALDEIVEGLTYIARLLRLDVQHSLAQQWLEEALARFPADQYDATVCALLQACYAGGVVKSQPLSLTAARQLVLLYGVQPNYSPMVDFKAPLGLSRDPLFLDFLAGGFNCVPEMELFLTDLRLHLLRTVNDNGGIATTELPLLAAMSLQCFNNEYVFSIRGAEAELLEHLLGRYEIGINSAEVDWSEIEVLLLTLGMFSPLHELPSAEKVAAQPMTRWQPCVQLLLQRQLVEPLEEQELRGQILEISPVEDVVSAVVQSTYEQYPYPRWTALPQVASLKYADWLRSCYPHFHEFDSKEKLDTLVAGCGTGQHPIALATRFSGLDVTAIDLSTTSLAYGQRMANLYGVSNVNFLRCDLLNVGELDRRFDHIESVGVLHHMADPAAGLRALLGVLKPGGIIKLSLYSELARGDVNHVRTLLPASLDMTDDQIRAVRYALLCGLQNEERSSLYEFRDFYTLYECRDLLFHPQEHQFTIGRLKVLIDELDLEFLGFELGEQHRSDYDQRFPADKNRTNLENWQTIEEESPRMFLGMYQFHVTRKSRVTVQRAA
jgi:SAM-dependent methyltransferase/tetratricopeptide (TPR) repeat protein